MYVITKERLAPMDVVHGYQYACCTFSIIFLKRELLSRTGRKTDSYLFKVKIIEHLTVLLVVKGELAIRTNLFPNYLIYSPCQLVLIRSTTADSFTVVGLAKEN